MFHGGKRNCVFVQIFFVNRSQIFGYSILSLILEEMEYQTIFETERPLFDLQVATCLTRYRLTKWAPRKLSTAST